MHAKANAEIEIGQRRAMVDHLSRLPAVQTVGTDENGAPVVAPDNSAAVLGPLMVELTQALKALSAPKQIVYGPNGEPIGVKPMVA
jgi:hypothetical protein